MKLLIVDDDTNIQRLYKEELEEEGYDIVIASTGKDALEMFEKENPDIVTLDILMPDIDGISLLRKMKENYHTKNRSKYMIKYHINLQMFPPKTPLIWNFLVLQVYLILDRIWLIL